MERLTERSTVGEWIAQHPEWAVIFEQFKIDYCCGGKMPLDVACRRAGLDTATLISVLGAAAGLPGGSETEVSGRTLTQLADHIERDHHAYLRQAMPAIHQMSARVAERHGDARPALRELFEVFDGLSDSLTQHMHEEEEVVFPAIRRLEALVEGEPAVSRDGGGIQTSIVQMEHEHEEAGQALAKMRELTDGFAVSPDCCKTYSAMLRAMAAFEQDMHRHIHKENSVLFPKAAALEAEHADASYSI